MLNKKPYLDFISDEDLFECISVVYDVYRNKLHDLNYNEFVKNKIDPFKMMFDIHVQGLSVDEWVAIESNRQIERAVSNAIGYFHEALIDKISNFKILSPDERRKYKIDLIDAEKKIYVEVKNKHNTVKGEDKKAIFKKLENIVSEDENATCIFLNILGKDSKSEMWTFSTGRGENQHFYGDERILHVTGDYFYHWITGDEYAFARLCAALPFAIRDFEAQSNSGTSYSEMTERLQKQIISTIRESSESRGWSMEEEIIWDGFNKSNYLGFKLER